MFFCILVFFYLINQISANSNTFDYKYKANGNTKLESFGENYLEEKLQIKRGIFDFFHKKEESEEESEEEKESEEKKSKEEFFISKKESKESKESEEKEKKWFDFFKKDKEKKEKKEKKGKKKSIKVSIPQEKEIGVPFKVEKPVVVPYPVYKEKKVPYKEYHVIPYYYPVKDNYVKGSYSDIKSFMLSKLYAPQKSVLGNSLSSSFASGFGNTQLLSNSLFPNVAKSNGLQQFSSSNFVELTNPYFEKSSGFQSNFLFPRSQTNSNNNLTSLFGMQTNNFSSNIGSNNLNSFNFGMIPNKANFQTNNDQNAQYLNSFPANGINPFMSKQTASILNGNFGGLGGFYQRNPQQISANTQLSNLG